MNWLRGLWNRFFGFERQLEAAEDEANRQSVIREAFRTGKPVFGTYDEKGKFVMKILEPLEDEEEE